MARRSENPTPKPPKEPGRFKQMWQVFQMTRRYDSQALPLMLAALLVPVVLGVVAALLLSGGNVLALVLYIIVGLMLGVLLLLIVLGRRAEKAAYSQIEGQPGAVGAVMKSGLRRSWRAAEMPVAVQGRTQAAVYRAVGKGGVVLIAEGAAAQTKKLVDEERRKVARILPNVAVTVLHVGPDADAVPLHKLAGRMNKVKSTLNRNEVLAVSNRLQSLGKNGLPIPKGVDPFKVRSGRPR
ncbi:MULTISPECIES: DUF4191 family protein [Frigoribacterium]|jgi:hypothetical protein|uniref:DUF4191 family protein n=1 Tax=Frigoribacterium TaxID=96492 RepID=UPI001422B400|nr:MULTISPECIES: DUF4191 family protein [Frigoribacterium]MBD8659440.1 DUF4191 family protein [Frigoribacterium sp. CFBP 8754]MBD8728071.1 DUF4191 family protein [Frigoribacterium sp. CFBP 13707]NII50631.1 hypothetical protein [Frigoribacterium endophyticum]QNE42642.1 DUF4191 family protein [Frigoribacterium sp. NBH87]